MKILLVGRSPRTRLLLATLRKLAQQAVTHHRDSRDALEEIADLTQRFDYVIWEQDGGDPHRQALRAAIDARQPELPVAYLNFEPERQPESPPLHLVGAFEKSRKGKRVLNCNLARSSDRQTSAPSLDEIIFEYQAPCRRTGT